MTNFPVGCANSSQVITFQVSHKKYETNEKKTNGREFAFRPFLLALELLDISEVETNDATGVVDDIAFTSVPELL